MQSAHALSSSTSLPVHVAIIMDGNGRWARQRSLPRILGHRKGTEALRHIMEACRNEGVRILTIYAFSSENWQRPHHEVSDLMDLLRHYLVKETAEMHKNGIRIRMIGDRALLAPDIQEQIIAAETLTQHNRNFTLVVALSYGARQEITQAVKLLAQQVNNGALSIDSINEGTLDTMLYTHDIEEPDLLIRTGGEKRLSNFLLWQCAYTELYFTDVLWPDFSAAHLREALEDFAKRERRYGNTH